MTEAESTKDWRDFKASDLPEEYKKAFEGSGYIPDEILWRYKVQYTQGAGCESLGERLAEREISDGEYRRIKEENPKAIINSREAAYY